MEGRHAVRMTTSLFASRKDTAPQSPGSTNGSAEETSLAEVTGVTNNAVRLLKSERPSCTLCKFWQMVKDLAVAATENGAVQRQISGHLEEKKGEEGDVMLNKQRLNPNVPSLKDITGMHQPTRRQSHAS